MTVVDASVLAPAVLDDAEPGTTARAQLARSGALHAPQLVIPELLSRVRRAYRARSTPVDRCERALARAATYPMTCHEHSALLAGAWELRDRCSAYDAFYIALARSLDVPFLTADGRLARAVDDICDVRLVNAAG